MTKDQTANIRAVARRAGVSASTVSRTLRGSTLVAQATRDRVLRAASDLAYSLPPGPGRPGLVAVLSGFPTRWYVGEAISGIEHVLSQADQRTVLHNIGNQESRQNLFERVLPRGQLDGVIVISASFTTQERQALRGLRVPITVVGGFVPEAPCVGIDEAAAVRLATQHLIGLGHRKIGLVSFSPEDPVGNETTLGRRSGFEAALAGAGLPVVPEWIVLAPGSRMLGGIRATEDLLTLSSLPTALVAMSDELAFGTIQTLRRASIEIPRRMSIIGFDDHEMASIMDITTIAQPVRQQAEEAARTLLSLIDGATDAAPKTDLPVRLVIRGTTGPVPPSPAF